MKIVKITRRDDGEKVDNPVWCISVVRCGSNCCLCTYEVYGFGEGSAEFKEKNVDVFPKNGCKNCRDTVKEIRTLLIKENKK